MSQKLVHIKPGAAQAWCRGMLHTNLHESQLAAPFLLFLYHSSCFVGTQPVTATTSFGVVLRCIEHRPGKFKKYLVLILFRLEPRKNLHFRPLLFSSPMASFNLRNRNCRDCACCDPIETNDPVHYQVVFFPIHPLDIKNKNNIQCFWWWFYFFSRERGVCPKISGVHCRMFCSVLTNRYEPREELPNLMSLLCSGLLWTLISKWWVFQESLCKTNRFVLREK